MVCEGSLKQSSATECIEHLLLKGKKLLSCSKTVAFSVVGLFKLMNSCVEAKLIDHTYSCLLLLWVGQNWHNSHLQIIFGSFLCNLIDIFDIWYVKNITGIAEKFNGAL